MRTIKEAKKARLAESNSDEVLVNESHNITQEMLNETSYYFENGKDLNKALEWINLGIASNPNAFWNIHTKAKIQKALGDKKGAMATAQQSIDLAKKAESDFGYVKLNEELMKTLK